MIVPPLTPGGASWTAAPVDLRVVTANLHYGGLDLRTGDDAGLRETIGVLAEFAPAVVALQEVDARNPRRLWAAVHRIANELGMSPVLGPPATMGAETGNHVAILVRTSAGIQIVDQWPPPGGPRRPWVMAALRIPGLERLVHVYSVHLPARTGVGQLENAQCVGSWVTEHDDHDALVMGDFNTYPRRGPVPSAQELAELNPHLRQSRTIRLPNGDLAPNLAVDDALVLDAGLVDLAAEYAARIGALDRLGPTGGGGARVDRCYATRRWADALTHIVQLSIGSDHEAVGASLDLRALTR